MPVAIADCALAQLGMMDEGPVALIRAAASAGFGAIGLPLRSGALRKLKTEIVTDAALIRQIRTALAETSLNVFDVEALVLGHLPPEAELHRLLGTAAELGASRISCLGHEPHHGPGDLRPGEAPERLAWLADLARQHGIRIAVEFMAFRAVNSLDAAVELIRASGSGDTGIVVDALHAFRTGATPEKIAALPPGLISHFQICDARADPAMDLPDEARRDRLLPGEGVVPLAAFLAALPAGTPLSLEIPVAQLLAQSVAERTAAGAATLATL